MFFIIITLQLVYCLMDFNPIHQTSSQEQHWISLQNKLDSTKAVNPKQEYKEYSYNPNFISDFKAYKLGMTLPQINRLRAFRELNKFANSPEEFQAVTGISDSLLEAMAPNFKFPDWVNNPRSSSYPKSKWKEFPKKETLKILDINQASKEDLMKVFGIGDAISDRILKQKEIFGGFVSMDQMTDIWGLTPEVIAEIDKYFIIESLTKIKKININTASIKELGQFYYFKYPISKNIVTYRSMNGDIKIEDLSNIKGFPVDKLKIIALYLEF
ncbi:ComEA family DNA-binding protein [Flavobacterium sp.]|uniref:ComEA family DNA-binding protein n=1 Tax=Flavobacterium sp. TaxID=239 RepID=UPI0037BFBE52